MSGKLARSLLAVAVGLAGLAALPQASPVGAQNAETVTRTLDSGVAIEMPAGKFYTVVHGKTGKSSHAAREGDLLEFAVLFGETPDADNPPQFTCSTVDATAGRADFVGGDFPLSATQTIITLPIVTKAEFDAGPPLVVNLYDPGEEFSIFCRPDAQYREWLPWRSALFHITILDQVEPKTPPTTTKTVGISTGPVIMATVAEGKFYALSFHNGDGTTAAEGLVAEGDLAEFTVAMGEQIESGEGNDLTFSCATFADPTDIAVADSDDYVGGQFPATVEPGVNGFTLPLVTKHDTVVEPDEYFWIECMPTGGDTLLDWRAYPSPRMRYRLVDNTTEVSFTDGHFTIEEGSTADIWVIADSKGARLKGTRNSSASAVVSFVDADTSGAHPEDFRFSGTQAVSITHTLGSSSIEPQAISVQAVDNNVCERAKIGIVELAPTSESAWAGAGTILGGLSRTYLRIVDDEDPPDAPHAVAADLNGSTMEVEWLEPSCPYLKGVEIEYKIAQTDTWATGLTAGREWDYDGDGDPSNNVALTTSHTLTGLVAGAKYDVRVRYHNDGGAGAWKQTVSGEAAIVTLTSGATSAGGPVSPPPTGGTTFTPPPTTSGGDSTPEESETDEGDEGDEGEEQPPAQESPRYTVSERDPACEPDAGLEDFPFVDVAETSYARGDIGCLIALAVTTGTSATTYSPSQEVTREQMASFLARLFRSVTGEQAPAVPTPFTDVVAGSTHAADIARLYGLGITTGASATAYFPDQIVDREQMASFIAKFYEVVTGAPAPVVDTPFTDLPADAAAADDIARIWGLGITTGATPATLAPAENVTREQMASFLARLYRVLTEQGAGGE